MDAIQAHRIPSFLAKIQCGESTACWPWTGVLTAKGYGCMDVTVDGKRRHIRAHRAAYVLARGPIPPGLTIDHLCRNRRCCNPWHLEAVTSGVNVMRGIGHAPTNARKTHCANGHPFTPENTRRVVDGRACRICTRLHDRQRKDVRKRRRLLYFE